ncbi:N-acetylmuramoyl-L-alanine amidase [uncultured Subdoligranulum sp.]|uniref:peptidoglycan recognition protein family protein n=1 Tax=uncultured Subdoligranulum sp. TaxID=512298 RepID=UPI0025E3E1B4|nr:N-acetylmuramoyl-L-alanine amidase [uncultured Subdoligranulum sp.]
MSNSALVSYTQISPNCNIPRRYPITKITPHHMAGAMSLQSFGATVAKSSRAMSANYAIDVKGNIGLFCNEANRSWCSSSPENDHRAITIEVANDGYASTGWHVSDASMEALVNLCVDICQRNPGLANGLNYTGDARGNLTKHQYFTATQCPGTYLGGKFSWLAQEVNKRLAGGQAAEADALRTGMALHLQRVNLYVASTSLTPAASRTGTYYLWGTEVVSGRVRITNTPANAGRSGQVTGWINLADAKAAAGIKDQVDDNRGLTTVFIPYASSLQAMAIFELAKKLDLVDPGYYRSKYIDPATKSTQKMEIGQISAGDTKQITDLCDKIGVEYTRA